MGKSKNKTDRICIRLTPEERKTLNDILEYRGVGISKFFTNAIDEETKKVKKEKNDAYIQRLINGENAEY